MSSKDKALNGQTKALQKPLPTAGSSLVTKPHVSSKKSARTSGKVTRKSKTSSLGQKSLEKSAEKLDDDKNSKEMATTSFPIECTHATDIEEQETDVDSKGDQSLVDGEKECLLSPSVADSSTDINKEVGDSNKQSDLITDHKSLPYGWEEHIDQTGHYFWHVATGIIQRDRPTSDLPPRKSSIVLYHDDEEINVATHKTSSDDGDDDDLFESGAALTVDDTSESTFVVYPLGSCLFDETQLISATSSKAIQKCILRLCNKPASEERFCWGLDQTQPVLMKLYDEYIQFTDLKTQTLLRSQPIKTIKTWAVDEDNNFAFVIEDRAQQACAEGSNGSSSYYDSVDFALSSEPTLMCYVFTSMDDDDMSIKVAAKLNEEITRYKEHMSDLRTRSTRLQQMIEQPADDQTTDADEEFDELMEASSELTLIVKYIGKTQVPRPTGIDVLNVAIDKCLADAIKLSAQSMRQSSSLLDDDEVQVLDGNECQRKVDENNLPASALIEAKLHVSPSSVIVESVLTGEIIVECRIRFLTFIGISKRDIRWCGFIMQNATNKSFTAHCFECYPTAGHVCEAIQLSCTRMYEKVVKNNSDKRQPETLSLIPTRSKIRNTLAKTFSRIKLNARSSDILNLKI